MNRVAEMDWIWFGKQGWYCPFGCHMQIVNTVQQDGTKAPLHLSSCNILIARSLQEERLQLFLVQTEKGNRQ